MNSWLGILLSVSLNKRLTDKSYSILRCTSQWVLYHAIYSAEVLICSLQSLLLLQAQEQEISDYEPHRYAYEEEPDENLDPDLDPLTIPETDLQQDILTNLDSRFSNLAAVCRPDLMSSSPKILG